MMPGVAVMVPDLEIDNKVSKINACQKKCCGTPMLHIHYDGYKIDNGIYFCDGPKTTTLLQRVKEKQDSGA
jgi:hypothetical protein